MFPSTKCVLSFPLSQTELFFTSPFLPLSTKLSSLLPPPSPSLTNGEPQSGVSKISVEHLPGDTGLYCGIEVLCMDLHYFIHPGQVYTHTTLRTGKQKISPCYLAHPLYSPPPFPLPYLCCCNSALQSCSRTKWDHRNMFGVAQLGNLADLVHTCGEHNYIGRKSREVGLIPPMVLLHCAGGGDVGRPYNVFK